jgi:hypothetical protein
MYVYVKDRKDLFENVCIGTKHYKTKDAGALFIRCNDVDRLMTKMDIDQLTFDKLSLLGINLTNHDLLKRMTY